MRAPGAGSRVVAVVVLVVIAVSFVTSGGHVAASRSAVSPPSIRLADLFGSGGQVVGNSYVIGGLGSSVGAGATLTNPGDAPEPYFEGELIRHVPGAGLARWSSVNDSVVGSTIHDGLARDWAVLKRSHPDVVVLAYGMNDGAVAQFNMGETFSGAMTDLRALIGDIRSSGAVPVILTTPSPHTARVDWNYPEGPRISQASPIDTSVPVRIVPLSGGRRAPESTRHAAVNEGFRETARSLGVDLIDVEPLWLTAVADRGQDALFDPGEYVHPNLLGHRLSYHAAIDEWFERPSWTSPLPAMSTPEG